MTVQNHNHTVAHERPAVTMQNPVAGATDRRQAMINAYRANWWRPTQEAYKAIFAAGNIEVTDEVAETVERIGHLPLKETSAMTGMRLAPGGTNWGIIYWTAVANELLGIK